MIVSNNQETMLTVSKTALGVQVMKDRSVNLTAQQRSALILCDGKRSANDVVRMTSAVGVTHQDIMVLSGMGLISIMSETTATPSDVKVNESASDLPSASVAQEHAAVELDFGLALNTAITLCSNLGFKGFGLNMALADIDNMEKLQKLAPGIRRAAGDAKYMPLHALIFGKPD